LPLHGETAMVEYSWQASLLLTPPKTIQIALRLLAGQIEDISMAQRSHTQKHTNVTKARAQ